MSWTVADAVDYKGFPADRSKTGGWVPAALILGLYHFSTSHVYAIAFGIFNTLDLVRR